jgi:uncharacterized protein (TIGR03083 family)
VNHVSLVEQIPVHTAALRAAAVLAGPDAPTPTCPGWTVRDLVAHVAESTAWIEKALALPADAPAPEPPAVPAGWDELLSWWDERAAGVAAALASADPAARVWSFVPVPEVDVAWYARRLAHENAIHSLDAAHAAGQDVPALLFDTAFAADGVDELLAIIPPVPAATPGTILLHAADAGRAWLLTLSAEAPVAVDTSPAEPDGLDADARVVGTADAVYRAVWGRPSHAIVSGDPALVSTIKTF